MSAQPHPGPSSLEINLIERVNVGDILTRAADLHPQRVAIVDGDRRLTYAQLERQVDQLGHALLGLGLKHQDVVAVMARNVPELLTTYFACARAGLICAPVNLGLRPAEIAWCLRDARARVLIAEGALAETAREVLAEPLPDLQYRFWIGGPQGTDAGFDELVARGADTPLEVQVGDRDVVQLLYTSGTTANPKGVLTSHLAVTMSALSNAIAHQCGPGYTALVALPLFHCAMLNSVTMPVVLMGGRIVLAKGFEPHQAAALMADEEVQLMVLLPMMYGLLLGDPALKDRTYPAMKRAMYAMAPMPEERLKAIHAMFPNADVVLGSGQTEFTPATCMQRPEHQWSKAATWGTATAMTRVAIMDEDGRLLPRGETGELVYRGPQVMSGYLNQPEVNREVLRHGWFHSGDVAHIDEDGAIWFKDRYKDVIKTGGENVASVEVERCLMEHPAVAEAGVIGKPDPVVGEVVKAFVSLKTGQAESEALRRDILAHARKRLGAAVAPKEIAFLQTLPRTRSGKIMRRLLKARELGLPEGDTSTLESGA